MATFKIIPSVVGVPDGQQPSSFSDWDNGEAVIEFHMVKTQSFYHTGLSDRNGYSLISPYGPG